MLIAGSWLAGSCKGFAYSVVEGHRRWFRDVNLVMIGG